MSEKKAKKEKKKKYHFEEVKLEKMIVRAKPAGVRPPIPQPKKKKDNEKEG